MKRSLARSCRAFVNTKCLHPFDIRGSDQEPLAHQPVFIVGAPRCGSTLLSQVLVQTLDVGYFTNLHAQFYGSPAMIQQIIQQTRHRVDFDFNSEHGKTRGWFAPSENGEYWYRFFRRSPAYVGANDIDPRMGRAFRRSIQRFTNVCGRPIILKNLYAALRLEVLQTYLPEAKYIVLHRDFFDNAASILRARKKHHNTYDRWWSVEIPNHTKLLKNHPIEQVVSQIDKIYALIDSAQKDSGDPSKSFLHLNYKDLCDDPKATVQRVNEFIPNCNLRMDNLKRLPDRFTIARNVDHEAGIFDQLFHRIHG